MKKGLLLCFLFVGLGACLTTAKKVDFVQEMDGFREYKWGTYVGELGNSLISQGLDEGRNIEWFTKSDDTLSIGKAHLESITYIFHAGRFAAVSIVAKGEDNCKALQEELEESLGKTQPAEEDALSWDLAHTSVFFSYNKQSEAAMLVIRAKEH